MPDYRYLESPLSPSFGEIRPRNQSSILFHLDEDAVAPCSRHFSFCEHSNSKAFEGLFILHLCHWRVLCINVYIAGTFKPSSRTR
jgi:hypothetical protein